ncbi:hypothetical protein DRH14_02555 [Candidatus Shapirobacteria bacterium]|nr:MAG: hypothetical protein DRH14_02555 [Candidatus Shapirobacteria bacterium]
MSSRKKLKAKIFTSIGHDLVKKEISEWLEKHQNIEITHVAQSECAVGLAKDLHITITVFYKEREGGEKCSSSNTKITQ